MIDIQHFDFKGKKALVRVDYNVPLNATYEITDDTRIKASLPTIHKILQDGGAVILMSHLGRPKEGPTEKYSLKHLCSHISKLTNTIVHFASDCISEEAIAKAHTLNVGEILLLENLRFYKEEEKGDTEFAKKLASIGDVYVNDAFGTAHRAHASTAIIANYFTKENKMFGFLMQAEVNSAEKVISNAQTPFTAIIGGAKVSDKILLIEKLLDKAQHIIIGGGMSYTFLKAQGYEIGNSLCEPDRMELALSLMQKAKEKGVELHIPIDSVVADKFAPDANTQICVNTQIPSGWMGLDIGTETVEAYKNIILNSKTILWNGPMGVFEMEKFRNGTQSVALAIADATTMGAYSLIGGGDSVAAINLLQLSTKVSYVSTGGGALLEIFEGKNLPGIAAIRD